MLTQIGMIRCKPVTSPVEPIHKPKKLWDNTPNDKLRYQKLIGKLIYLSHIEAYICYYVSFVNNLCMFLLMNIYKLP